MVNRFIDTRIRERRMMLDLTQPQLAKLIGVTYQQIHRYELGTNSISASQLYEIARGSGTPVECFFEGLEEENVELPPPPAQAARSRVQFRRDPEREASSGD
jgi:transcriptional regulator with XRE-family HTH domain